MASFKDAACHHCGNVDLDYIQNTENKKYYIECIDCEARGPEASNKGAALARWRKDDKAKVKVTKDKGDLQAAITSFYLTLQSRAERNGNEARRATSQQRAQQYSTAQSEVYNVVDDFISACNQHGVIINGNH